MRVGNYRNVADKHSVLDVDRTIRETLPPTGGVVNGAMVLSDRPFSRVTLDMMQSTFDPKVKGTILLNELYSGKDMDFFILFGSLIGSLGNQSQSCYAAANTFMSSIISGRGDRGLVGSIINPGPILGVGYTARMGSRLVDDLNSQIGMKHEKHIHFIHFYSSPSNISHLNPFLLRRKKVHKTYHTTLPILCIIPI